VITTACARPCDNSRAGPKAAWTNYPIFWEVGFLARHITLANRKVYLAGIGETDDFRLRALRLQQEGGEVRRVQRANRANHIAAGMGACVAYYLVHVRSERELFSASSRIGVAATHSAAAAVVWIGLSSFLPSARLRTTM